MPTPVEEEEFRRIALAGGTDPTGTVIPPQPGAGPNAQGLDLSAYDTPNQPAPVPGVPVAPPTPVAVPNVPVVNGTTTPTEDVQGAISDAQALPGPTSPTPVPAAVSSKPTEAAGVAALDQARASGYAEADAKAAEGQSKADKSEADAGSSDRIIAQKRAEAEDLENHQKAVDDGRAKAAAIRDAAASKFENFKFHDYWGDMTTPERVRSKIAVALGAWNSSTHGGHNMVLDQINTTIDQQHRADETKVRSLYDLARLKREGALDFEANMQSDLATAKLKQAALAGATAEEAKQEMLRNGIPLEKAETNTLYKGLLAKRDQDYATGMEKLVEAQGRLALERYKAKQAAPEDPAKLAAVASYAAQPGVKTEDVYAFAAKIGIRDLNKSVLPINADAEKQDVRTDKNAAAADKKSSAEEARTFFVDGKPYLAPSSRLTDKYETRVVTYEDAITSLHELLNNGDTLPIGSDAYNRAVLAIAAVSTNNITDKTTEHEANTIKRYGLINREAIEKTLEHVEDRYNKYKQSFIPASSDPRKPKTPAAPQSAPSSASKGGTKYNVGDVVSSKGKMYRVIDDEGNVEPVQ